MIPVVVTFAYFFSVVQIMGMEARYYMPALPFFVVSSFLVFDWYLEVQHRNLYIWSLADRHIRLRLLVIFGLIALLVSPAFRIFAGDIYERLFLLHEPTSGYVVNYKADSRRFPPKLGWWLSIQAVSSITSSLPQGTRVAMSEYGFIGAQSPHIYIIDPLVNDPVFAHQGFSAPEFFDRKPDLIWLPHPDYTAIVSSILTANEFWTGYDYYPGAFDYGIAIRRDSPHYQVVYKTVEKIWKQRYKNLELNCFLARPVP